MTRVWVGLVAALALLVGCSGGPTDWRSPVDVSIPSADELLSAPIDGVTKDEFITRVEEVLRERHTFRVDATLEQGWTFEGVVESAEGAVVALDATWDDAGGGEGGEVVYLDGVSYETTKPLLPRGSRCTSMTSTATDGWRS